MNQPLTRIRLAAAGLALAGVLFALYPGLRPWRDETTPQGAQESMSSGWWVASHLFAMVGFILVPLALLAVRRVLDGTRAEPLALTAAVTTWLGAGLTLPFYGAEDFALHVLATRSAAGDPLDLVALTEGIRYQGAAVTTFGIGLILLGVGAVLAAVAIARSGVLPRWSGVLFAIGFATFLPQFFTPAPVRVAHGVLLAAGCLWLATTLWRTSTPTPTPATAAA